jgi:NADPH:quinone reductase-like Zn-dependent oxidoreductase
MKAFIADRYSKKDPLRLGEMPVPELRDDEVLIEVHAAGVNVLDAKIKSGEFKLILPYRMPLVLGHDVAGVVTQVGSRVRQFKSGDAVYSRPADHRIGTFAQFIAANENDVAPKPKNVTMEAAASIPLVGLTREIGAPWFVNLIVRMLSSGARKTATRRDVKYSFLFMRASGQQLREITRLIEAEAIRPVIDRVFAFESTNEALAHVAAGRAKGKVVIKIK